MSINSQPADADVALFGNRFVTQEVPSREFPETGIPAEDALRLVSEDLALEGDPARNLATFVTTWMEPQAQQIIAANLHRNFIDHAEYPRTAEIEQRDPPTAVNQEIPQADIAMQHAPPVEVGVCPGDLGGQTPQDRGSFRTSGGGRRSRLDAGAPPHHQVWRPPALSTSEEPRGADSTEVLEHRRFSSDHAPQHRRHGRARELHCHNLATARAGLIHLGVSQQPNASDDGPLADPIATIECCEDRLRVGRAGRYQEAGGEAVVQEGECVGEEGVGISSVTAGDVQNDVADDARRPEFLQQRRTRGGDDSRRRASA